MSISAPGIEGDIIYNTQGLKHGCPLSPTLYSLYIADVECWMRLRRGLTRQCLHSTCSPLLLYPDDMALLGRRGRRGRRGLQAQHPPPWPPGLLLLTAPALKTCCRRVYARGSNVGKSGDSCRGHSGGAVLLEPPQVFNKD